MSEGPNPFAPPRTEWGPAEDSVDFSDILRDARLTSRFVHYAVDTVARVLLGGIISGIMKLEAVGMLVTLFGYHLAFEAAFGRTPAKWLTGTRVVTHDGRKPSFLQILGRTLLRYVPFEPFSFLFSGPTGWHDRWSRTRVVYVK